MRSATLRLARRWVRVGCAVLAVGGAAAWAEAPAVSGAPTAEAAQVSDAKSDPASVVRDTHSALAPAVSDAKPAPTSAEGATKPVPASDAKPAPAIEVRARGGTRAERLQRSAEAVNVVDTRKAQRQSADLGEVMARAQGVSVRRSGGLGSEMSFSLDGLQDEQVRFFLDGVPLELAGYPFGLANVPVNLVQQVELYRGVVPLRFGADALGGAVNLVSDSRRDTRAAASYQLGSFGTHRATLDARYHHEPSGFLARGALFLDRAENDYPVTVELPNDLGQLSPVTVPRFHDAYLAYGGSVEVGVADRVWARHLSVQGYAVTYDKELQSNTVMTVPYGEARYGETLVGATARYQQPFGDRVELELLASYARRTLRFVDASPYVYDWYGEHLRERANPGELESIPHDQLSWEDGAFARVTATVALAPGHSLRVAVTPRYTTRTGDERLQADPAARDPLTAQRALFTLVSGAEHEAVLFDGRLQNLLFVKDYVMAARAEEIISVDDFQPLRRDTHHWGLGDALRFRVLPWLYAKASYEHATRLPRPDETFGDGVQVRPNLHLDPEVSDNANLGARIEARGTVGELTVDVNAFWRESDRLIVLLSNDRYFLYQNLYRARGLGAEGSAAWVSPGQWVTLDGALTYQDVRNRSTEGAFREVAGDRIPNRPWLFGSWGARVRIAHLLTASDTLEPFYAGRWVNAFYRGWESQGLAAFKQVVPTQVTHTAGVTYALRAPVALSVTLEVQNLTDQRVYDVFGGQRPGRAFSLKLTGEL